MPYKDAGRRREYLKDYKAGMSAETRSAYRKTEWANLRRRIIEQYGGKCECCGEAEYGFLSLDHRHGGGHQERKRLGPNAAYRLALRSKDHEKYRVLCHNCNMGRQFNGGVCPHEQARAVA